MTVGRRMNARIQPCNDDHFWFRIDIRSDQECWEWTGARSSNGYGNANMQVAHRVAYEKARGQIPPGLVVMHSCDNPPCCNPNHLSLGTTQENAIDMADKGRNSKSGVKFSPAEVREMRRLIAEGGMLKKDIAAAYQITKGSLWRIERGMRYARV